MARNHLFTQRVWQAPAVKSARHALSIPRLYRHLTASRRRSPDFIIAGAAKAGTTSLWWYLVEHPLVEKPLKKEICFFDLNYHRGINWYRMHFPRVQPDRRNSGERPTMTGEGTPYYMFHPLVPQRVAAMVPNAKVILLLRDPVERAFSHYHLMIKRRFETLSFEEAINAESERLAGEHERIVANPRYYSKAHDHCSYMARGLYLEQIRRWEQYFPPEQLLIIESGELFKRTDEVYQQVLDYLGLPRWQPARFGNRYPGNYSAKIEPHTRRRLVEFFAPHNELLFAHLGTRFDWDSPEKLAVHQSKSAA